MKKLLTVLFALALTACASRGFDRGALHAQMNSPQVVNDDDIKKALEAKAQMAPPFRIAVYFMPAPQAYRDPQWHWNGDDKDQLLNLSTELKAKGVVSDLILLNDSLVEGTDHKNIRLAAARAGADAVLVVKGASDIDRYSNALGISYVLLVPAFFVPGTHLDGLFLSDASLWDVRNGFLYLSTEVEGHAEETRPAFFADSDAIVAQAKADAMGKLGKDISQRLLALAGK